jgi:predicted RNA-binding protein associated with RNAse of E/G family
MTLTNHPPIRLDLANQTVSARDGLFDPIDRLAVSDGALYFGRHGANNPGIAYPERWLLPEQGWVVSRWTMHPEAEPFAYDWYVDIDRVDIDGEHRTITDRYLDLIVREHLGYEVLDADELAEAMETGAIAKSDGLDSLRALDSLCKALRRHDFSMKSVLQEVAPGLPGSREG